MFPLMIGFAIAIGVMCEVTQRWVMKMAEREANDATRIMPHHRERH